VNFQKHQQKKSRDNTIKERTKMFEKLQEIVRHYTSNEEIDIKDATLLLTDLGFNSFELVKLISELEKSFNVEIPDRALIEFKTVQDVLDYLSAQR